MKYEYHNFIDNFNRIKSSKDMALTRELVVSEIAKVIDGRPFLVKKALVDCGVVLSEQADKKELTEALFFSLASNSCLRNSVSELIIDNQYPVLKRKLGVENRKRTLTDFDTDTSRESFMNQAGPNSGSSSSSSSGGGGGQIAGAVLQVVGLTAGIVQGNKQLKDNQAQRAHEMQLAQMNSDLALQQMNLYANQPVNPPAQAGLGGGSMVVYILGGIAVVGLIGYAIYASRSKSE